MTQNTEGNVPRPAARFGVGTNQPAASVDAAAHTNPAPANGLARAAMAAPPTDEQTAAPAEGRADNDPFEPDHLSADETGETMQAAPGDNDRPASFMRRPFGSQLPKLYYEQRAGYHRHWFNDKPGRVDRAKEAGYSIVEGKDGKPVCRVVTGGGLRAFLMEIPLHLYKQDMAAQQRGVDEIERTIRDGTMKSDKDSNRYVPKDGIRFREQ